MTYSHKIDPNTELCRFELAGGICNDAACDLQHFRDLKLPGAWVIKASTSFVPFLVFRLVFQADL
jgi:hypothetical protein